MRQGMDKTTRRDMATYAMVIIAFIAVSLARSAGILNNSMQSWLVPICVYVTAAVSLNLTVGVLGELSLGHGGFMSIGAFTGVVTAMSLSASIPSAPLRLALSMIVGAVAAALAGFVIGIPVLRLHGDYLAIVTLAFGEIIKELINCLIVGYDSTGLKVIFNVSGAATASDLHLEEGGIEIIKGAQGAVGTTKIASFTAGFILVMITLIVVQNLIKSRAGRAIMAVRDNEIAARSIGINITGYKLMAFVTSAALAGGAGALYAANFSSLVSSKFDFNTSILVLVYVVLGGLGNIRGSIIAAVVLYILPEAFRGFSTYRMLIYAIVLIVVMIMTNNPTSRALIAKIVPGRGKTQEV